MQAVAADAVVRHCMRRRSEASACRHTVQRHCSTKIEVGATQQHSHSHCHLPRSGSRAACLQYNTHTRCMRIALCISTAAELDCKQHTEKT